MMRAALHPPKTLFVLADGGRARLVERFVETGQFVTFEELSAPPRRHTRPGPVGRSFESATPTRHGTGSRDIARQDKEAFVAAVAARAAQVCAARGMQRVCVSTPSRLVGAFRAQLAHSPLTSIILERDLAKTPDHALGRWLDRLPVLRITDPPPARKAVARKQRRD